MAERSPQPLPGASRPGRERGRDGGTAGGWVVAIGGLREGAWGTRRVAFQSVICLKRKRNACERQEWIVGRVSHQLGSTAEP